MSNRRKRRNADTRRSRGDAAAWGTAKTATSIPATSSMTIGCASCPRSFSASPLVQIAIGVTTRRARPSGRGARKASGMRRSATAAEAQVAGATGRWPSPNPVATRRKRGRTRRLPELLQDQLAGKLQRVEDAVPSEGHRLEIGVVMRIQFLLEFGHGDDAREIALVVLHDERDLVDREPVLGQVVVHVHEALDVRLVAVDLRIGHEDDAVDPLQDELPARVVVDLTRHRIEVEAGAEAPDLAQLEREEVEEEGAVHLGREGDHLPARLLRDAGIDMLQVRRL